MNIQLVQKVVNQWRMFVEKKREVRSILVTQYKQSYLKVLYSYKEFKKKKFQQYIITNASKLIYKALQINLQRVQNLKQFIKHNKIKRFYILKQQDNIFHKITKIQSQNAILKTIRLPKYTKCEHNNLIPLIFRRVQKAVILFNFHYMKKYYGETTIDKDMIKNEFLYYFTNYVTVKRPWKQYQLTNSEYDRYQHVLQKVDKFQLEEYTLLKSVELKNINILKKIYLYNRKNKEQQLQIYFDYQLNEIGAACKIQKFFRGKKDRKIKGMQYSVIIGLINQSRAIFVIQKWFRRIRQFHRNNFFKDISFFISQIPTEHLYLDMEIYQKIEQIVQNQQYTIKFLEQYNTIVSDSESVRLMFSSQTQNLNQSTYQQTISQLNNLPIKVIPQWLIKQIQMVPVPQQKFIDYTIVKQEISNSKWSCRNRQYQKKQFEKLNDLNFFKQCDIYSLLHLGAKISFDHICKRSYIRFTYKSTSEARYRALALALITYKFKFNGVCIQMLNDNLWESPYQKQEQFLQKYYQKIQKAYKIESQELLSSNLQNSTSNCLILCQNEFQAEQFKLKQNEIQLQFFNDTSRIPLNFIWMSTQQIIKKVPIKIQNQQIVQSNTIKLSSILQNCSILQNRNQNEDEQQFEQSIQSKLFVTNELSPRSPKKDGINKSTQLPLKYSVLCIDNPDIQFQEPKFKRRTEQSYLEFAMTSRYRTQNNPLNSSKVNGLYDFESNNAQNHKKKNNQDLENISENTEYTILQRRYKEFILNENKTKGESLKSQKPNEKILLSEFTNLISKQGKKIMNNQIQTQRAKSIDRQTKKIFIYSQLSQSVTKREDYKDYSLAFPKIEQKSSKKYTLDSRLSNYQKYQVFPEDQYTMAKDTIKF